MARTARLTMMRAARFPLYPRCGGARWQVIAFVAATFGCGSRTGPIGSSISPRPDAGDDAGSSEAKAPKCSMQRATVIDSGALARFVGMPQGLTGLDGMAVSAGQLIVGVAMGYTANGYDELVRLPVGSGGPVVLVDNVPGWVDGLVVAGTNVIYGAAGLTTNGDHDGSILSVALAGGKPTTLASGLSTGWRGGITTDGDSVYWADSDGVHSAPVAGGPARTITAQSALMASRVGEALILDDENAGNILSIPIDGGAATTLATGQVNPVAAQGCGGGNICWSDEGALTGRASLTAQGAEIVRRDPSGQLTVLLAPGVRSGTLLFDGQSLFSMTGDCCVGAIMRITLDGSSHVTLATTPGSGPIAVDDECVYFGNPAEGIFSINKAAGS
jgi:hypothetical protein